MLIKQMLNWEGLGLLAKTSGAGDQKWARGQLKYDGFPVLWSPK